MPPNTTTIPAGATRIGSTLSERAAAVDLARRISPDAAWDVRWIQAELPPKTIDLETFEIMRTPVTELAYWQYAIAHGQPEPLPDPNQTRSSLPPRSSWIHGHPSAARSDHPVVGIDHHDARTFCRWWGQQHHGWGDLPSEAQWEKAARGAGASPYPSVANHANTRENEHVDTTPVGAYPHPVGRYDILDMAGNVFEWTRTPGASGGYIVKGGSWNTSILLARPAARHERPSMTRHAQVGFRCIFQAQPRSPRSSQRK